VGLSCIEATEVLFIDTIRDVRLDNSGGGDVPVDPIFLEVVEPGSLYVLSAVGKLGPCGAAIADRRAEIHGGVPLDSVTITVAGKRRGMISRLVRYSSEVAARNNAFWNQAWK